jgi:hypothetical protein
MNLLTGKEENVMEKIKCKDKLEEIRGNERKKTGATSIDLG